MYYRIHVLGHFSEVSFHCQMVIFLIISYTYMFSNLNVITWMLLQKLFKYTLFWTVIHFNVFFWYPDLRIPNFSPIPIDLYHFLHYLVWGILNCSLILIETTSPYSLKDLNFLSYLAMWTLPLELDSSLLLDTLTP